MADEHFALDESLRSETAEVLSDARCWKLPEARWDKVATVLGAITAAERQRDVNAFRDAVYELELCGPHRAVPVGGTSDVPAPEKVRVELDRLGSVVAESAQTEND